MISNQEWETRLSALWEQLESFSGEEFVNRMNILCSELSPDNPIALFEKACARDSTGHSDLAVPLYQQALEIGLVGIRRRRACIQMASSLRNIGKVQEGLHLLEQERHSGSDELDDALDAFLALMLVDSGREREAVSLLLEALSPHLPRYQRSVKNYAKLLIQQEE